jgi:hypothetical protein
MILSISVNRSCFLSSSKKAPQGREPVLVFS